MVVVVVVVVLFMLCYVHVIYTVIYYYLIVVLFMFVSSCAVGVDAAERVGPSASLLLSPKPVMFSKTQCFKPLT